MKVITTIFLLITLYTTVVAQNDELRVQRYLKEMMPAISSSPEVLLVQCKYKSGHNWQYLVACRNRLDRKASSTLLFAERTHDTTLRFEPFYFTNVISYDHLNLDNSRDGIEELYITTAKDSGNLAEKFTGIYSYKNGLIDTLIRFYSYAYKTLKAPWFTYRPGIVVEQEDICKLTDINGDGKTDISNRVHRKILNKQPGSNNNLFVTETDYAEYKFDKGKFVRLPASKATEVAEDE